jgi:hypothetical protein
MAQLPQTPRLVEPERLRKKKSSFRVFFSANTTAGSRGRVKPAEKSPNAAIGFLDSGGCWFDYTIVGFFNRPSY